MYKGLPFDIGDANINAHHNTLICLYLSIKLKKTCLIHIISEFKLSVENSAERFSGSIGVNKMKKLSIYPGN